MTCSRRFVLTAAALGAVIGATGVKAQGLERRPLNQDGLVGEFHFDPAVRSGTAVILLSGSDGGLPSARDARDLASAGFPTLSLAYFKDWNGQPEGVPAGLSEIPLEYFFRAIDWLKSQAQVDPRRIVLAGLSRGAELALLLASLRPDIAGVAAFSPSSVVWRGVPQGAEAASRPAWTLGGQGVPYQIDIPDPTAPIRRGFENAVANPAARIAVEKITGPVLLVSSPADRIWPSDVYANEIAARLATRSPSAPIENLRLEDASHLLMGTGPGVTRFEVPGSSFTVEFGGTPEGTLNGRARAWRALKALLSSL
ncbi:MAG TPA: acyl-CoA thioester hydrolase/BAAT C-terminal domain-containing protein [Brevundimonas sp.]|jgi:hypothetical protein